MKTVIEKIDKINFLEILLTPKDMNLLKESRVVGKKLDYDLEQWCISVRIGDPYEFEDNDHEYYY